MTDTTSVPALIDLRSDTVTRPTPAMRAAMAAAEVGDDVYGDDPTVNALERRFAEMVAKPAALFVTSGTQGNQICLHVHCRPGDEIIADRDSHIIHYEAASPAALTGAAIFPIPGDRGRFTVDQLRQAIRHDDVHYPASRVVLIENTHNRGGGTIWPADQLAEVCAAARLARLATHLDGARLWNAVAATGVPLAQWAGSFDSLSCCFSKGLGCPVGSIIAGSAEFIRAARRVRKIFGGQLRQVGVLAAAALYALDHHWPRLADDHANAATLAEGLARFEEFVIEAAPATNMIFWSVRPDLAHRFSPEALTTQARQRGVLFGHTGGGRFRAVTHLDVSAAACRAAVARIGRALLDLSTTTSVSLTPPPARQAASPTVASSAVATSV